MPGTPGPRTGLAQVNPTGESPTILRTTANAIISWLEANAMLTSAGLLAARPVSTPGSPGISGRRYYATDTGVEYRDTGTSWVALGVELVSALPASPYNGQIVDYLADATNGVVWRLRYRSASASAYKWEYLGGGSLTAESQTLTATSSSSYSLLASPPTISTPLAGDYIIEHGCQCQNNVADGVAIQTVKLGTTASGDGESTVHVSSTAAAQGTPAKKFRRSFAASANLHTEHRTSGAGTATFVRQWLNVTPVRVV